MRAGAGGGGGFPLDASHETAPRGISIKAANCSPDPALVPLAAEHSGKFQEGQLPELQGQLPAFFHLFHVGEMQLPNGRVSGADTFVRSDLLVVCHHHCTTTRLHPAKDPGSLYVISNPVPWLVAFCAAQHCLPEGIANIYLHTVVIHMHATFVATFRVVLCGSSGARRVHQLEALCGAHSMLRTARC